MNAQLAQALRNGYYAFSASYIWNTLGEKGYLRDSWGFLRSSERYGTESFSGVMALTSFFTTLITKNPMYQLWAVASVGTGFAIKAIENSINETKLNRESKKVQSIAHGL